MTRQHIHRFFQVLARELDQPATVILTGAAAAAVWGGVRPSLDVDFGITPARGGSSRWRALEEAVARTTRLTGIQANYAADIDRWGAITLLDYRRRTLPYRRFGTLTVRLLHPAYWSIGKMTRYLAPDLQDLVTVLRAQRVPVASLVRLWGRALRRSPPSAAVTHFRNQAEHFLRHHGRTVWGTAFDPERAVRCFRRAAGLSHVEN